jgi:4-hydroxybutyrate CoA-transferase
VDWRDIYQKKLMTADEAVKTARSGDSIYFGLNVSIATVLTDALVRRASELRDVSLVGSLLLKPQPYLAEEMRGHFFLKTMFLGDFDREAYRRGMADVVSLHLSQYKTFIDHAGAADIAFLDVSRPDSRGYMSYGISGGAMYNGVRERVGKVILQANDRAPYVYGDQNYIHVSEADGIVEASMEHDTLLLPPPSEREKNIAAYVVEQIPDGACLQIGIGGISNAVGYSLDQKNDLGVHTELMTECLMYLAKKGVITGKRKTLHPGKIVMAFCMGSKELYEYLDHNPLIHAMGYDYVNDSYVIGKNDNMISVNNALMVDLTGQVHAEGVGFQQYSGTGGQLDFVKGAQLARGGKSFIVLNSTLPGKNGREAQSKIVAAAPPGTPVTTPRADTQYVVTEYGCVNLKKLLFKDRARALISIAHPDFRPGLTREAKAAGLL